VEAVLTEKLCTSCRRHLPATEEYFYYRNREKGTFKNPCRDCVRQRTREYHAKRLAEDPDGYRQLRAEAVRRYREKNGSEWDRKYSKARGRALERLRQAHPEEFERYLAEERTDD
jgi:hypothetical protein